MTGESYRTLRAGAEAVGEFEDRRSRFIAQLVHVEGEKDADAFIDAARRGGADFAVDVYPHYGSDVEATLRAGHDLRHGLIGPGVYASHGYERSHRKGVEATLRLLWAYLDPSVASC